MKKEFVSYSEAFKLQVVEEISQGKFASILQAQKPTGFAGRPRFRVMDQKIWQGGITAKTSEGGNDDRD